MAAGAFMALAGTLFAVAEELLGAATFCSCAQSCAPTKPPPAKTTTALSKNLERQFVILLSILTQSFGYTPKVKRLVHYRNGITMADTLGGSHIAVKPHL